ncbi:MAG: hypothetical protein Q4A25_01060 [Candidatus Saccharibacteria bacterium]|nr:hypothetical protein [Candidatus Saccharibacteria bacterium]
MSKKVGYTAIVAGLALASLALPLMNISGTAKADETKPAETISTTNNLVSKAVDETVYVFLDAGGNVKKTISSDWVKNDLGTDVYTKTEGKVDTPITMKISYFLDDKEVTAEEIRGRSGHVKIRYDFTNNERVNGMYVPYAVLSGAVLPNGTFTNIKLTNAKLINDGTRTVVAGLALPGMKENLGVDVNLPEHFEIEADAKDFKMEMTATIATSKVFADLDTSALNSVDALSSALQTLSDSMLQLLNGSTQLRDGLATLNSKTGVLADGVSQLRAGSLKLVDGAKALSGGASDVVTGATELSTNLDKAATGAKELDAGVDQTIAGVSTLAGNLSELDKNSQTITSGVQGLIDATLKELKIADITIENYPDKFKEAISKLIKMGDIENANILKDKADKVGKQLGLYQGILNYVNGASAIAKGAAKTDLTNLKTGSAGLSEGLSKLSAGSSELTSGLKKLAAGSDNLYAGLMSLDAGVSNLESNIPALTSGVSQLADGSKALTDGLSQFNDAGVQKLVSLYNGNVKALVSKIQMMVNLSRNSSKVKYLYRTDEI